VWIDCTAAVADAATLSLDDRTLLVKFDRKVDVSAAKVRAGNRGVIQPELTMAGHAVRRLGLRERAHEGREPVAGRRISTKSASSGRQ
jgi:hypothetical protein